MNNASSVDISVTFRSQKKRTIRVRKVLTNILAGWDSPRRWPSKMCHLILFMPVLALPIFWLMPLELATPIYIIIALIAALLYWLIAKSMSRQPETGSESLIGATAEVVSQFGPANNAQYLVRSHGELWTANSPDAITTGETVSVTAVNGILLVVRRNGNQSTSTSDAVRKSNERHCH